MKIRIQQFFCFTQLYIPDVLDIQAPISQVTSHQPNLPIHPDYLVRYQVDVNNISSQLIHLHINKVAKLFHSRNTEEYRLRIIAHFLSI